MTEDYDVLSMSESEEYADTDTSTDEAHHTDAGVSGRRSGAESNRSSETSAIAESNGDNGSAADTDHASESGSTAAASNRSGSATGSSAEDSDCYSNSSQSASKYYLPQIPVSSSIGRTATDEPLFDVSGDDWQLSCLESETPRTKDRKPLHIIIGTNRESDAREVAGKLAPAIPKARLTWAGPGPIYELIRGKDDSNPANYTVKFLSSEEHRRLINTDKFKVVKVCVHRTSEKYLDHSLGTGVAPKHITYNSHPTILVTTEFLGTNERNSKASMLSSLDAPLLWNSSTNVYTPLTIDMLDMLDEDMLHAMQYPSTVAWMTTPEMANTEARWPAYIYKQQWPFGLTSPPQKPNDPNSIKKIDFGLLVVAALFLTAFFKVAIVDLNLCKWAPPAETAGPKDLQVWQPQSSQNMLSPFSRWLGAKGLNLDVDSNAVSVVVAKSNDALLEYIHFLHIEALRHFAELRDLFIAYRERGRDLFQELLESETAQDLKLRVNEAGDRVKLAGGRLWQSAAREQAWLHAQKSWKKASEIGRRGSVKLQSFRHAAGAA